MTIIHKPFFEHYHLNICEDGSKQIDKQKCSFQLCDIKLFDLSLNPIKAGGGRLAPHPL